MKTSRNKIVQNAIARANRPVVGNSDDAEYAKVKKEVIDFLDEIVSYTTDCLRKEDSVGSSIDDMSVSVRYLDPGAWTFARQIKREIEPLVSKVSSLSESLYRKLDELKKKAQGERSGLH